MLFLDDTDAENYYDSDTVSVVRARVKRQTSGTGISTLNQSDFELMSRDLFAN